MAMPMNEVPKTHRSTSGLMFEVIQAPKEPLNKSIGGLDPATSRRVTATSRRVTATSRRVTATSRTHPFGF